MKVIIVGKTNCPNCVKAKKLCESVGVDFQYQTLYNDVSLEKLFEMCGGPVKSVPQVFISSNGFFEYIGGYKELKSRIS